MMEMNGTLSVVNQHHVERAVPRFSGPVEVVLVNTGEDLKAIADILRDAMAICIPDPTALEDALPLILFEELPMAKAEILVRLMARAGGRVEVAMRIGDEGRVTEACLVSDEVGGSQLRDCLIRAARATVFPRPRPAGSVDVSLPLRLQPSYQRALCD